MKTSSFVTKKNQNAEETGEETFSVIIPVHNGANTLDRCLNAIKQSEFPVHEILVIDDGSTDTSRAIAEAHSATVLSPQNAPCGPAVARNLGADYATGSILLFIDSDVVVHSQAVEHLTRPLRHDKNVVATFGSYDSEPDARTIVSLYANLRHHYVHQQSRRDATTFWSGCGAVRRNAFLELGGFDVTFDKPSVEDIDLGLRLTARGGHIQTVPNAQAKHLKKWKLRSLWKTDIFRRAVPWSQMMLDRSSIPDDLNTQRSSRIAAVLAHFLWIFILLAVLVDARFILAVCIDAALFGTINAGFFRLLARKGGWRLLLGGTILHWLYYLYGSITFALLATRMRWRYADQQSRLIPVLAWILLAGLILGLCFAAAVSGSLSLFEAETVFGWTLRMDKNPENPHFTLSDIRHIQTRAVFMAGFYFFCALGLIGLGSRSVAVVVLDAINLVSKAVQDCACHWIVLSLATVAIAMLAGFHLSQVMRYDESISFLNYGLRPIIVSICFHESTNNHILHSIFMRASVVFFGNEEWAIRLPAYVACILTVPAMYLAGKQIFDRNTGLIAAVLWAGAVYTIEIATNSRGYAIMILLFVLSFALLPAMTRRRPGAWVMFVIVTGFGAWAVPMMLYPFAIAVVCLWFFSMRGPVSENVMTCSRNILFLSIAVGVFVFLLYSPTLVVVSAQEHGTQKVLTQALDPPVLERASIAVRNLHHAWQQWTFGWSLVPALCLTGLMFAGWSRAMTINKLSRSFAFAVVLAPPGVFLLTGLAPPPWYALAFLFPVFLFYLAHTLAFGLAYFKANFAQLPSVVTIAVLILTAGVSAGSDYPERFPHYAGYHDARKVVRWLDARDLSQSWIVTDVIMRNSMRYYLFRMGYAPDALIGDFSEHKFPLEDLYYVTRLDDHMPQKFQTMTRKHGLHESEIIEFPHSHIFHYSDEQDSHVP